ncbi:flagellar basal-body rod protein FlgF [Motiliproteus sp. MSK22-1]|uniref:flagellar basal-body rod protein FlgF n=1 Tax=Motiliproteus sp. MSK22-1 TaxID=1897630 RepID=UPI000975C052|nr:flagellar basal-body rod protein FlgF [Motiliproteus sp. MSK22-1]OMH30005.1 flagellar basal-body rod protein FlgF [Motiliproteus sp. MSK22-1]
MDNLLYLSMTGAKETMLAQASHANNLANARTTGFKADLAQARAMQVLGPGHESRVYAMTERPATDQTAGALNHTGRDLDVAVQGQGWLAVQSPDGTEAYTRAGELQISATGQLLTGSGLPLLGDGGPIELPPAANIDIGQDGTISVLTLEGELAVAGRIKLVNPDPQGLVKGADGLMRTKAGEEAPLDPEVQLESGYLETSNVNAVNELTSMLDLARRFEMNIKMMQNAQENSEASARILQNLG